MEPIKNRLSKVYEFEPDVIQEMLEDLVVTVSATASLSERLTILTDWLDFRSNYFTLIWLGLNDATEILLMVN